MKEKGNVERRSDSAGLTLVELMVTLAVLAIVVSLGAPGLMRLVQNQAAGAAMQSLTADLRYARSEAIKRGSIIEVCAATVSNATPPVYSCTADPSGNNRANWGTSGWIVRDSNTGDVMRVAQRPLGVSAISGSRAKLSFLPTGIVQGLTANITVTPLMSSDTAAAQTACLNTTGRTRIVTGSATC